MANDIDIDYENGDDYSVSVPKKKANPSRIVTFKSPAGDPSGTIYSFRWYGKGEPTEQDLDRVVAQQWQAKQQKVRVSGRLGDVEGARLNPTPFLGYDEENKRLGEGAIRDIGRFGRGAYETWQSFFPSQEQYTDPRQISEGGVGGLTRKVLAAPGLKEQFRTAVSGIPIASNIAHIVAPLFGQEPSEWVGSDPRKVAEEAGQLGGLYAAGVGTKLAMPKGIPNFGEPPPVRPERPPSDVDIREVIHPALEEQPADIKSEIIRRQGLLPGGVQPQLPPTGPIYTPPDVGPPQLREPTLRERIEQRGPQLTPEQQALADRFRSEQQRPIITPEPEESITARRTALAQKGRLQSEALADVRTMLFIDKSGSIVRKGDKVTDSEGNQLTVVDKGKGNTLKVEDQNGISSKVKQDEVTKSEAPETGVPKALTDIMRGTPQVPPELQAFADKIKDFPLEQLQRMKYPDPNVQKVVDAEIARKMAVESPTKEGL